MRTIVCDEDATVRAVVTRLATSAGHSVLAETDSATDAVDMVVRFGADVLIIDLALPWGAGLQAVRELRESGAAGQIVVFTSWAADSPEVRGAGVRAVIEKPDFESLERVLVDLAAGITADTPEGAERRARIEPRSAFPNPGARSISGLEHPATFDDAAVRLQAGDAVLVVHVSSNEPGGGWFGKIGYLDQVLAIARLLRSVLRAQDRLSLQDPGPDDRPDTLVALVLGGGRPGVEAIWRRLEKAHEGGRLPGVLSGGWSLCDDAGIAALAVARARDAAARSVGRPPGDRLWAG